MEGLPDETGRQRLAKSLRSFATYAGRDTAPQYADICRAAAGDGLILDLLSCAPPRQRRPTLLLAAVHYLLLAGVDSPLADLYPTVVAWRQSRGSVESVGPVASPAANPMPEPLTWYPHFADLCRRHRRRIEDLLATRATQTNEIGRCSALFPVLCTVAGWHPGPLAVVDLGASAGLNLLLDRFAYCYVDLTSSPIPSVLGGGDPDSRVRLTTTLQAGGRPDLTMPPVAWRIGIDRSPVDPLDDEAALWLLACQWPEHPERFERLRHALALARSTQAPAVVRGDVIDDLGELVATVPEDTHLCLVHSWVAPYLSETHQRELHRVVAGIASTRPVSWMFAEEPFECPGLPIPPSPDPHLGRAKGATAVVLVEMDPVREARPRRMADMHPHGRWLRWWGAP